MISGHGIVIHMARAQEACALSCAGVERLVKGLEVLYREVAGQRRKVQGAR